MPGLRVLITNCWVKDRGGTELYVYDLASGLLRAGHHPMVWSPILGGVADTIRAMGVPVYDDLTDVAATPDLVHGHHGDETRAALSRFPDVPGVYVCHDAEAWQDEAPLHPRLLRYLAVDELCRERLLARGVDRDRTAVVLNAVDLDRFPRRGPLPPRPSRALLFANTAREAGYVPAVRAGCERAGVELDVAGSGSGQVAEHPERLLGGYDVVLAKGRSALEALAVGCAVVLCDLRGVGGMVTADRLPELRRWNLGRRLLTQTHDPARIAAELARYDAGDSAKCTDLVRAGAGLGHMVDTLLDHYAAVLAEWRTGSGADAGRELVDAAAHLQTIGPLRLDAHLRGVQIHEAGVRAEQAADAAAAAGRAQGVAEARARALGAEIAALAAHTSAVEAERDRRTADALELRAALDAIRDGRTMRWRSRVLAVTGRRSR